MPSGGEHLSAQMFEVSTSVIVFFLHLPSLTFFFFLYIPIP